MQVTFKHKKINSEKLAQQFATLKFTFNECHSKKLKQCSQQNSLSAGNSPEICPIKIKSQFKTNQQSQKTIIQCQITVLKNEKTYNQNLPTPKKIKFNPQNYQNLKITPKTALDSPVSVANIIKWKSTNKTSNITHKMRRKLIDWMQQVAFELDFHKQVVFRAVQFVDQYIIINPCIDKKYYQLIGLASLLISCKLDNIKHPTTSIFLQSTNNAFSSQQLFDFEIKITKCLQFKLNPPNLYGQMQSLFYEFTKFLEENPTIDLPHLQILKVKRQIFILLDGVIMLKQIMRIYQPLKICLSILYIYIKKQDMLYNKYHKRFNTMRKLLHQLQYIGYGNLQTKFQTFLNYIKKDIKLMDQLRTCIRQLRLWVKFQCTCQDKNTNYHPQLFEFAENWQN